MKFSILTSIFSKLITIILKSISDYSSIWIPYESVSIICVFSWVSIFWSHLPIHLVILNKWRILLMKKIKDKIEPRMMLYFLSSRQGSCSLSVSHFGVELMSPWHSVFLNRPFTLFLYSFSKDLVWLPWKSRLPGLTHNFSLYLPAPPDCQHLAQLLSLVRTMFYLATRLLSIFLWLIKFLEEKNITGCWVHFSTFLCSGNVHPSCSFYFDRLLMPVEQSVSYVLVHHS